MNAQDILMDIVANPDTRPHLANEAQRTLELFQALQIVEPRDAFAYLLGLAAGSNERQAASMVSLTQVRRALAEERLEVDVAGHWITARRYAGSGADGWVLASGWVLAVAVAGADTDPVLLSDIPDSPSPSFRILPAGGSHA